MTLVAKRNGNGNLSLFPRVVNDLFDTTPFFGSDLLDTTFDFAIKAPSVNIIENKKEFKVELAAPGLEKKDFKVEVDGKILTISSEKEEETNEEDEDFKRREFSYTSFCRSFQLPEDVLADKIDAKYDGGILKLRIPKKEVTVSKPKKEIKVS